MTGRQIIDACREEALRLFPGHSTSAKQQEIELLREKVLEQAELLDAWLPWPAERAEEAEEAAHG